MRLNKYHKDAFVEGVLQDLPATDYDEVAQKLVRDATVERMPAKVRAVYDDKDVRHRLRNEWMSMPGSLQNFYCVTGSNNGEVPREIKDRLLELSQLKREQTSKKDAFGQKIRAAINSCQTRKTSARTAARVRKVSAERHDRHGCLESSGDL